MRIFNLVMMSILSLSLAMTIVGCSGDDGNNGASGVSGSDALVVVLAEPVGSNCSVGGQLIKAGNDVNANGILEDEEITTSEFICNGVTGTDGLDGATGTTGVSGTDGLMALVTVSAEPVGQQCEYGGSTYRKWVGS